MKTIYDFIIDIEQRAIAIGLPISRLCKEANVSNSTFTRWKAKEGEPRFGSYLKLIAVLESHEKEATEISSY
jgi:hypothetical protein